MMFKQLGLWIALGIVLLAMMGCARPLQSPQETAVTPTLSLPSIITPTVSSVPATRSVVDLSPLTTTTTPLPTHAEMQSPTLTPTPSPSAAALRAIRDCNFYKGIFIQDNLAFIGCSRLLLILDISVPHNPILVGQTILPGQVKDIEIVNNLAYLAFSSPENIVFQIVDVSIPSSPLLLGSYYFEASAKNITIVDNYAHLSVYDSRFGSGLLVLDISNPLEPAFVRLKEGPGLLDERCGDEDSTYILFVDNNYCYTATHIYYESSRHRDATLHVWDISQPDVLIELGTFSNKLRGFISDMKIIDQYAYLSLSYKIEVVDISDPTDIVSVKTVPVSGFDWKFVDKYAYVVSYHEFTILNISTPAAPFEVANHKIKDFHIIKDMIIEGDLAYFVISDKGLMIMDISNPGEPIIAGTWPLSFK